MRGWFILAGAILCLLVPSSAAQLPGQPLAPDVEFPRVTIDETVKPLDGPANATLQATIGCTPDENPLEMTNVEFTAGGPTFVNSVLSPAAQGFHGEPIACARSQAHEIETQYTASLTQNAPAFERIDVPVEMYINRSDRSYGPYQANVSLDVGYFGLLNARAPDKQIVVEPGGTASFPLVVENLANGDTRVSTELASGNEGLEIGLPEPSVLAPNQTTNLTVIAIDNEEGTDHENHVFEVLVQGASTNPQAEDTAEANQTLKVVVEPDGSQRLEAASQNASGVPAPGAGAFLALLAAGLGLHGRHRDPKSPA